MEFLSLMLCYFYKHSSILSASASEPNYVLLYEFVCLIDLLAFEGKNTRPGFMIEYEIRQ